MTLPASGAISLSQIAAEFGLSTSAVFPTAFYGKGGAPSSGALSFGDFYGRSNGITSATVSPDSAFGFGNVTTILTTPSSDVVVVGGVAAYTYSWAKITGDALTAVSPTSSSTAFRGVGMSSGELRIATFQCTVTDILGSTKVSNVVTAQCERS